MQTVEKFVINRNDLQYIYVEKNINLFNDVKYLLYQDGMVREVLNEDSFSITYGNDLKCSIKSFVDFIEGDVLVYGYTNETSDIIKDLKIVKNVISNKRNDNIFNPSLIGCKATCVKVIDKINDLIISRSNYEIDHQQEYDRLHEEDLEDVLIRIRRLIEED